MDIERAVHNSQREELRQQAGTLRMRIRGIRKAMRLNLNELTPEEKLPVEELFSQAVDLRAAVIDLHEALGKLDRINEILRR